MRITICEDRIELAQQAAAMGRHCIKTTIKEKGSANVAFVTGTSQLGLLENLRKNRDALERIAQSLLEKEVLEGDEFEALAKQFAVK